MSDLRIHSLDALEQALAGWDELPCGVCGEHRPPARMFAWDSDLQAFVCDGCRVPLFAADLYLETTQGVQGCTLEIDGQPATDGGEHHGA